MRTPVYTKQFSRDVKRMSKRGKNLDKLKLVVRTLVAGETLDRLHRRLDQGPRVRRPRGRQHREVHREADRVLSVVECVRDTALRPSSLGNQTGRFLVDSAARESTLNTAFAEPRPLPAIPAKSAAVCSFADERQGNVICSLHNTPGCSMWCARNLALGGTF